VTDSSRHSNGTEPEPQTGPQEEAVEVTRETGPPDAFAAPAEELLPDEEEEMREAPELEVLQGEMALLEQQLEQIRDRYIRAVADLDNSRKRARQAIAEARHQAVANVLFDLLPLLDNFERALETVQPGPGASQEALAIYDGVALIHRQLKGLLEQRGVKPIEAMGETFDPALHEAVAQVPADGDQKEGTVALEMQKGYMHGDRVLRPSRVGVVVRPSATED
jgi:molecular chaperone GrpE